MDIVGIAAPIAKQKKGYFKINKLTTPSIGGYVQISLGSSYAGMTQTLLQQPQIASSYLYYG